MRRNGERPGLTGGRITSVIGGAMSVSMTAVMSAVRKNRVGQRQKCLRKKRKYQTENSKKEKSRKIKKRLAFL